MFGILSCTPDSQPGCDGQGTWGKGILRGLAKGTKTWSRAEAVDGEGALCKKHREGRSPGLALDWAGEKELKINRWEIQDASVWNQNLEEVTGFRENSTRSALDKSAVGSSQERCPRGCWKHRLDLRAPGERQ